MRCTWTDKMPQIMDPILSTVFIFGYWAIVLASAYGIMEVQVDAGP